MNSVVPVVGAGDGSIINIIGDGNNGYMFPPGSHGECAEWVGLLLENEKLRDRMEVAAGEDSLR